MQPVFHPSPLKARLLAASLLAGAGLALSAPVRAAEPATSNVTTIDDGIADNTGLAPLPTGQLITPTAAPGANFSLLNPDQPEYTPAVANYPYFKPDGAIASTLSPNGKILAVMTSGYNVLDDIDANLVGTGAEFIILYDVTHPATPVKIQTLRPANTFVGLAFSRDGSKIYVSGGADDDVIVYTLTAGQFVQSTTIGLGHGGYPGLPPNGLPGGIGYGQYPQAGGLALSRDGALLAIVNSVNNSVSVINTATNTVAFEYDLRPYNTTPGSDGIAGGETLYSVAFKGNDTLYATSVRDREVVAISIRGFSPKLITRISLPGSPNNLLLNHAQDKLYVAQDNSDTVAVIDTLTNQVIEEIDAISPPGALGDLNNRYTGAATNNVALSPDEKTLFITNGGANDVAMVRLAGQAPHKVAALVPTAWYPTTVTISRDGSTMYVFNAKSDPGANPAKKTSALPHLAYTTYPGGNTFANEYNADEYVFQLERGGLLVAPVPKAKDYASLTAQVVANNGWSAVNNPADAATIGFLQQHIQHVIYIVKENRTFDQELGDLTNGANGDPSLTIFGAKITPSLHAIASDFVTLDNFFASGEVSGNGWPWTTEGRETDWNEKNIPMNYTFGVDRGDAPYDAEGQNNNITVGYVGGTPEATVAARQAEAGGYDYAANAAQYAGGALNMLPGLNDDGAPDGPNDMQQQGHIWDAALAAGLSVRNYGFFSDNYHYGLSPGAPGYSAPIEFPYAAAKAGTPGAQQEWTSAAALIPYTDPYFRGFDNGYPDLWRFEEFQREFKLFEKGHNLPNLILLRFMHDHMGNFGAGQQQAGLVTAEDEQADNDLAVGKTVELLSKSPEYAGNTLVFITEDDAQDGGDHMDAHRCTSFVVGPYVKQGAVVSTRYASVSMLRTIEDVLSLKHLNLNTAYQRPMTDVFDTTLSGQWRFTATASTILKTTTLLGAIADSVRYAKGGDIVPTHSGAWWAEQTKGFDFSSEDRVPAAAFNKVLWKAMKGDAPYPATRTGIVLGHHKPAATPVSLVK